MDSKQPAPVAQVLAQPTPGTSYLEWGAVFGGVALAGAIATILTQFGAGVGLSVGAATLSDGSVSWNVLVAGLWSVAVAVMSSAAGGYVAGRMRSPWGDATESEVEFRDGVHGVVAWAVATLLVSISLATLTLLLALGKAVADTPADAALSADALRIGGNVTGIFAFAVAAGAAIGAAAAWFAATIGGKHRDEGISVHEVVVPRMFRRG